MNRQVIEAEHLSNKDGPNEDAPAVLSHLNMVLSKAAIILPILSAALYVMVRQGYEGFYGQIGIRPEDVGIGQAAMIGRTAYALGVILLILAMGFAALLAPLLIPVRDSRSWTAFLAIGFLMFAIAARVYIRPYTGVLILSGIICISRAVFLLNRLRAERSSKAVAGTALLIKKWLMLSKPAIYVILVVLIPWSMALSSDYAGYHGRRTFGIISVGDPPPVVFATLLGISVEPVILYHFEGEKALSQLKGFGVSVSYLGEAAGTSIFWDVYNERILRLPTGTFAMCHTVHANAPVPSYEVDITPCLASKK